MTTGGTTFAATFSHERGEAVVSVRGEIDVAHTEDLWDVIEEALRASRRLVLDLGLVTFMDSNGLNVIVRAFQAIGRGEGAAVVVRDAPVQVRKLLRITGLDEYVQLE